MPETRAPSAGDIARRKSRFTFAKRRIIRIRDTEPKLTVQEREQLAALLLGRADGS